MEELKTVRKQEENFKPSSAQISEFSGKQIDVVSSPARQRKPSREPAKQPPKPSSAKISEIRGKQLHPVLSPARHHMNRNQFLHLFHFHKFQLYFSLF